MKVEAQKDEHGHLNWLKIYPRGSKKPLRLDYIWDSDGLTRTIDFSGPRKHMPSISDIMLMFNESFIERIGLVKLINLIEKIELIEKIDLVSLITEITNIKNVESLDLIDLITKISEITTVKTVDKVTVIDDITNIGTIANLTTIGTITNPVKVKTAGLDNIMIDLLKKGSYKAFKNDFSNDNGVTTPTAPPQNRTNTTYYGKWFMRGCTGHLYLFRIYCKRTGAGTLKLGYTIAPGMGEIGEVTITPGADWDWKYAILNKLWQYDSLFIYIKSCSADVSWGFDTEGDHDCLQSPDSGVTWTPLGERLFIRVEVRYGTIPITVGGIVNNIPIPSTATGGGGTAIAVPDSTETTIFSIDGSGTINRLAIHTGHDEVEIRIYVDGVQWETNALTGNSPLMGLHLNQYSYAASTPQVQLLEYNLNGFCRFNITIQIEFQRNITVTAYHEQGVDKAVSIGRIVSMLK